MVLMRLKPNIVDPATHKTRILILPKPDSDKMSLLVLYIKEIIELDNIHYSKTVLYQRNP
ncbi:hypothetical protein BpHYR1_053923 [Brachionus plicatilis]|uniref:Uncharacterized protein n=1 Tax=Brachionus plicatilis TaxID=10195 RepID=A0A3M7QC75_BRAPC|nr:hypothetical protein BpHYR1_053923 [Brachionus plicatilis]